jgi:hypothetical protein
MRKLQDELNKKKKIICSSSSMIRGHFGQGVHQTIIEI